MRKLSFVAALAALVLLPFAAAASPHPRECVMTVGPDQVSFNAFQEDVTSENFCQELPAPGRTTLVLDAYQGDLRDMNIEIRIVRNVKDWRDDLQANTLLVLPRKKYFANGGTMNFDHNFDSDGFYLALVTATSDDGAVEYSGAYPITVGGHMTQYLGYGASGLFLCAVAFCAWKPARGKARKAASAAKRSPAL